MPAAEAWRGQRWRDARSRGRRRPPCSSGCPSASPAVTAAERVQPVPCVEVVGTRGCEKRWAPSRVTRTSTSTSPGRCPPLTSTAPRPRPRIRRPAASIEAASRTSICARMAASSQVRRHDRGEGQQRLADHRLGVRFEQPVARGGDHHRIHDEPGPSVAADRVGHRRDERGAGEHAGLHGGRRQVLGDGGELVAAPWPAGTACTERTPRVFCAVSATMTEVP